MLGLGSNIEPELHLAQAASELRGRFPEALFSPVYRSAAVGMAGDDFLNACCLLADVADLAELQLWLKALEDAHGRDRSEGSWQPRTLDLDLLMVDGEIVDADFYRYGHIHVPANDLLPQLDSPGSNALRQVPLRL